MFATVLSRSTIGMHAPPIFIEADLGPGLPSMSIIGLPEAALRESKDRVRSALLNANFEFPAGRLIINLAPAELPKDGGRFDLAIALAILLASGQIALGEFEHCEFYGELSLGGHVRPVCGILPAVLQATKANRAAVVPKENLHEAQLVPDARVFGATHLLQVCEHIVAADAPFPKARRPTRPLQELRGSVPDLADVRGQRDVRRALEIVAAGGHSILLTGPPGIGKTMLANRLAGILPPMTLDEAIETAAVTSLSPNGFEIGQWGHRPFRAPHHTASTVALIGGGNHPTPGEVSLAHNGVLLLDELPEFHREAIEALREPLETATVAIARAAYRVEFPARFQLIATMNGCPCGYIDDDNNRCRCTEGEILRYRGRISGPFLDRLDLRMAVKRDKSANFQASNLPVEDSATVARRVTHARQRQLKRQSIANSRLDGARVSLHCCLAPAARAVLSNAAEHLDLSPRAQQRILKVSRTIADLETSDTIAADHVSEALLFHSRT